MATIALTADVARRTHSTWWVSALFVVTFVPSVVVGLVAGPLLDRLSRKRLLVASDVVRLGVFVLLPFAGGAVSILVLATVAGIANSFFRPAVLAGVPNLLTEDELASGTSVLQATDWLAASAGPVLGGALVSVSGTHFVYWINAATFLFSALLILRIPARLLQSEQGITRGHWRDLADGVAAFRQSRALRTALIAFGIAMVGIGLGNVAEYFLATRSLHSGAFGYGLLWTASGIGLVIGSIVAGSLIEQRGSLSVYPLTFLPWAAGALGAAVSPNVWVAALAMILCGFGNGLAFPTTVVVVQQYTSDRLRGRAFTLIISAHNALLAVGMVTSGALTEHAGARWAYAVTACLFALGGATAFVLSRGADRTPALAREQAA
jgi:MFS family permease